MRAAVLIPVYNHGEQVAAVVRAAQQLDLPVFVVNDGSTDNTASELAAIKGITLLEHPRNLGKGAALLSGFQAIAEAGCDCALSIDADGQHRPDDAQALLKVARQHQKPALVVGCRGGMAHNENVPWTSRAGRQFSNFWVWASGGGWIGDSQSGFRLYPLPQVLHLNVHARRYQFEVEVLARARRHGLPVLEAPISVVYQPKGVRVSHFRPFRDFMRNSATFCRLILERFFHPGK